MNKKDSLTPKQEKFCLLYVDIEGNASECYRMAYECSKMKPQTIWSNACRLLSDSKVTARIEEIRAGRARRTEDKRAICEKILMDIVQSDPSELYIVDEKTGKVKMKSPSQLPKRLRNAIKEISNKKGEVKYVFNGKVEAARVLGAWNGWDAPQNIDLTSGGKKIGELRIGYDNEE